jgi:hypothetical protein
VLCRIFRLISHKSTGGSISRFWAVAPIQLRQLTPNRLHGEWSRIDQDTPESGGKLVRICQGFKAVSPPRRLLQGVSLHQASQAHVHLPRHRAPVRAHLQPVEVASG